LLVTDLLDATRKNIQLVQPQSAVEVRHAQRPIVGFSEGMQANVDLLRGFLARRMYQHTKVNRICAKARMIVKDLFSYLMAEPQCLPNAWHELVKIAPDDNAKARLIADYIAGMTDRFAVQEHRKLFSTETML
jgi:dGTPase